MADEETTPLLKQNFESEKLEQTNTALLTLQVGGLYDPSMKQEKILKYDTAKVGSPLALTHLKNTFLVDGTLWATVAVYLVITAIVSAAAYVTAKWNYLGRIAEKDNVEELMVFSSYFSLVIGLMLGMYVSGAVGRWWAMRNNCLGGLWGAIDDITLILAAHMPDKKDRPWKEKVLRLGLLSHRLLYHQAQGKESEKDLQQIVDAGLMTPDEMIALKDESSKPQVIWVWILRVLHLLAEAGKIKHAPVAMPQFDKLCANARGSIGQAFAYTDTQVPFNYVHLLASCVILSNLVLVTKCGLVLGKEIYERSSPNYFVPVSNVFQAICIPFMYHAFFRMADELDNPFGKDVIDFPALAYHVFMRNECESFIRCGENAPKQLFENV